jgi:hypothetical protein
MTGPDRDLFPNQSSRLLCRQNKSGLDFGKLDQFGGWLFIVPLVRQSSGTRHKNSGDSLARPTGGAGAPVLQRTDLTDRKKIEINHILSHAHIGRSRL